MQLVVKCQQSDGVTTLILHCYRNCLNMRINIVLIFRDCLLLDDIHSVSLARMKSDRNDCVKN